MVFFLSVLSIRVQYNENVTFCTGTPIKRPSVEELMDPDGPYTRRAVDVSLEAWG